MDNIAMSAARAWAAKAGCDLQSLHVYADAVGSILFYRIRAIHNQTGEKWIRPMHKDVAGQYVLRLPDALKGKPMPLYGLNRLSHAPDATTWLVEGEKCADLLNDFFAKYGGSAQHLAITSGGATSASKADWQPMAGRRVIIWPDNDEAGAQYAKEVLPIITGLGCEVQLLDAAQLALDEKGDVVDWLAAHPDATPDDLLSLPKQSSALSENHKNSGKLIMRCMADIAPEAVTWLWPARIALGKITVIAGMPGLGKSQLTAMLAAHVTTGTPWPDGTALQHAGQVLFLSAEDDAADTIVPRLMAAGADLAKCHTLDGFTDDNNQERCINLAENIPEILKAMERHPDVRLVVIDPVIPICNQYIDKVCCLDR